MDAALKAGSVSSFVRKILWWKCQMCVCAALRAVHIPVGCRCFKQAFKQLPWNMHIITTTGAKHSFQMIKTIEQIRKKIDFTFSNMLHSLAYGLFQRSHNKYSSVAVKTRRW